MAGTKNTKRSKHKAVRQPDGSYPGASTPTHAQEKNMFTKRLLQETGNNLRCPSVDSR
jgi:hypothetical protein